MLVSQKQGFEGKDLLLSKLIDDKNPDGFAEDVSPLTQQLLNAGDPERLNRPLTPDAYSRWPPESTTASNRHSYVDYDEDTIGTLIASKKQIERMRETIYDDLDMSEK